jgi:hypothetical protein
MGETNGQIQMTQCSKRRDQRARSRFDHSNLSFGCLFRVSCFVLRVSAKRVSGVVAFKRNTQPHGTGTPKQVAIDWGLKDK